jgi:regulatory protein
MAVGDGLARVTYLPGAEPSPPPAVPDFATFFGESAADTMPPSVAETAVGPKAAEPKAAQLKQDELGRNRREVRAENVSMHALTRKGLSRWELEKTLLARDLDEDVVAEELDRLEKVGLLDDAALAETLVRTQHDRKGLGRSALTAELRRRHIPQEAIEAALEQVDDDDEQARATELAVKRAGQLSSHDLETAKRRLNGFLMRKGYSSSIVRNAVDEALSGRASSRGSGGVRFR